jgi:cytidylate kinase
MKPDVSKVIKTIIDAGLHGYPDQEVVTPARRCVVTISRGCGCEGERIAKLLAEHMGVTYVDKEIIDAVAKQARVDRYLMDRLDERAEALRHDWLERLFSKRALEKNLYRRTLVKVVLSITKEGCVILGRGANYILARHHAFHVRIVGSPRLCAQRIANERAMDLADAKRWVIKTDKERAGFVRELFGADIDNLRDYDLGLNMDRFDYHYAAELIIQAMTRATLPEARCALG